jgi:hypothetical protein
MKITVVVALMGPERARNEMLPYLQSKFPTYSKFQNNPKSTTYIEYVLLNRFSTQLNLRISTK